MAYTVEELAAAGYRYYLEVEGGEWWDIDYALRRARDMFAWCMKHGLDLDAAAEEVGGVLFMEE